jgi:hypothetical protein
MHPPRRERTTESQGIIDQAVDWLLTHCPFSTLAVLSILVVSPIAGPLPEPLYLAIPVVMADLGLKLIRRARRVPV